MRTLSWPLQMVQYFSQEQCSSVLSHITQTTGPGMGASKQLYLTIATRGKASLHTLVSTTYLLSRVRLRWIVAQNSDRTALL